MNISGMIVVVGISLAAFVVYLLLEIVFERAPRGHLADAMNADRQTNESKLRSSLSRLDGPVSRYAPAPFLRKAAASLYWAQLVGKWEGWNAVQFTALQIVCTVGGFVGGFLLTGDPVVSALGAYFGWSYPGMAVNGIARRTRRTMVAQLPEFIQLVSAQMSANVSMEEALLRTSRSPGLVGKWMTRCIQQSQGRDLIDQIVREARIRSHPN